jgi:hypothetical protein
MLKKTGDDIGPCDALLSGVPVSLKPARQKNSLCRPRVM